MTAVPVPSTFVDDVVLTAGDLNVGIRDSLLFLLSKPIAHLRQTTSQSISNGVATALTFNTESVDSAGGHSTSSNTSRYTAVYPGWYRVSSAVAMVVQATGIYEVGWLINGTSLDGATLAVTAASTLAGPAARTLLVYLGVGDYVELYVFQTSGGALGTYVATTHQPCMSLIWESN